MSWHWPPRSRRILRAKLSSRAFFSKRKKCATYLEECWLVWSSGFGSEIEFCDGKQSGKLFWKLELWPSAEHCPLQCGRKCHDIFWFSEWSKSGLLWLFSNLDLVLRFYCLLVITKRFKRIKKIDKNMPFYRNGSFDRIYVFDEMVLSKSMNIQNSLLNRSNMNWR